MAGFWHHFEFAAETDGASHLTRSPKTGLRFAPIFPELRPILEEAFYLADEGDLRCVTRYSRSSNLSTQMNRIIERAGLEPWEKTFQNLRASRRTELEERFANHVVNS